MEVHGSRALVLIRAYVWISTTDRLSYMNHRRKSIGLAHACQIPNGRQMVAMMYFEGKRHSSGYKHVVGVTECACRSGSEQSTAASL
eukprot:scaffold212864_cov36-Tisochrysis_lutea.AAC.1